MAKSIAFAADPSRLASLLLSYIPPVCAFVAPRHPGASATIIDRLSHSKTLSFRATARLGQLGVLLSEQTRWSDAGDGLTQFVVPARDHLSVPVLHGIEAQFGDV